MTEDKSGEIRKLNEALMNRELNASGLCPANFDVSYSKGWFYIDDDPAQRRPDLTAEARELYSKGIRAQYAPSANTFFLPME
ncbi:hypothetical protein KAU33_15685 [Candidatus Dependentiae bacterium]|nr:hypothetical protein [Candidatus Dependentiae bacterium]